MRVLLDSNVLVWWAVDRRLVRSEVDQLLMSATTARVLSTASAWELSIRWRSGKLTLPVHPRDWIAQAILELGLDVLPVTLAHGVSVADLPDHHKDPFDRLLIAQARAEGIPIVTADEKFGRYDVEVIAAR